MACHPKLAGRRAKDGEPDFLQLEPDRHLAETA
jgi:hypothetical protein